MPCTAGAMEGQKDLVQRPREVFLFVVNGEASVEAASPDLDAADRRGRPGRKRPHYKSRRGCLVCKQRRVKCDEQFPCSNCLKRHERCIRSNTAGSRNNELSTRISQPLNVLMVEDTSMNLLHLELFSHFQRSLVDTLAFSEIWEQVLPWSFQEPYIMCTILCLAAMHLATVRPQSPRYSDVAVQFLSKSASLFSEKLSRPVTAQNSEAVIAASILMHYISWSHIGFIDKQEKFQYQRGNSPLAMQLSKDPLLQLSFGVQGILNEAFRILMGSDSVFLTTGLYSPVYAIEEAILQQGEDPWRFVHYFMGISDDPRCQPPGDDLSSYKENPTGCLWLRENRCNTETALVPPQEPPNTQQVAFEGIAKRLSLLFCLTSISSSTNSSASQALTRLQPDIERCFFSFPVHYSRAFRELAIRGDSRALIILCHFYRAARILLTGPRTWWARQRSRVIECLILEDLTSRGLDRYVVSEGF
ncbi:hypothetical protein F5B22DRAFT_632291 [Xylaria bambusicola]|uniref:uncharacterized protein n=1 Tax=Xylaria bambusicola TaxID=326684 RepID=UPI002008D696|nr:uncharacterized protein F5B22DRAFT_632291 [Xylaria bambusicola]KAI0502717.1 hypothetical protein F5B22DRAFT_632291 [Xylaria bambusicola]